MAIRRGGQRMRTMLGGRGDGGSLIIIQYYGCVEGMQKGGGGMVEVRVCRKGVGEWLGDQEVVVVEDALQLEVANVTVLGEVGLVVALCRGWG